MKKLNILQYKNMQDLHIRAELSANVLSNNENYHNLEKEFTKKYNFEKLNTFSFDEDGFLGLLLSLSKKGSIAVSLGETNSLIEACTVFESLGFSIDYIPLKKDGRVDVSYLDKKSFDFIFLSSYVMDTFVQVPLKEIKEKSNATIISNASANFSSLSDAVYFDPYKLTGFFTSGVILFNGELFKQKSFAYIDLVAVSTILEALKTQQFNTKMQEKFKSKLQEVLKDDIYFFVSHKDTLPYTLHFALRNIKAREIIRTLGLDEIHITNGEGCSLGLAKPSRVIQCMGYDETTSRNALSLSFCEEYDDETVANIVNKIAKKYKQIKVLNEQ